MKQPRSIRFRLSLVFCFFFLLVMLLGLFSIDRLRDFNRVSADIRDLWLPNTRLLGDLNNFTSDFRTEEGAYLLSSTDAGVASSKEKMKALNRAITQAQASYEGIEHNAIENDLYTKFKTSWKDYEDIVKQALFVVYPADKELAVATYMTTSRQSYKAAEDLLGRLTDNNVASARRASDRADRAYTQAFWLIGVAMMIAGVMVAMALLYVWRAISNPLLRLADCMHRLADGDTNIEIYGAERKDEIGHMAQAVVVFQRNAIELMESQPKKIQEHDLS